MAPERRVQIALGVAALAAIVVLFGLFSEAVRVACLVLLAAIVAITSRARDEREGGWWALLALATAVSIAGALIAQAAQTLGGLIAILGGIGVLIAVAVGLAAVEPEGD